MSDPFAMPPAQRPAKKRKKWPWIAGSAAAIVLIAAIASAAGGGKDTTQSAASVVPTTVPPVQTTDPAVAAASGSAAQASRDAAASRSTKAARQSSEAARQSSEAAEAQRRADEEAARRASQITYSVTTTGPGINSVTYLKPDFNISQETNLKGKKWSKTIQTEGSTLGINMNAQNAGGGTITCKIARGTGDVISENSSSGEYAVVSCG